MAFRLFITPHRGHLMTKWRKSASASFLLQQLQRTSFTDLPMRVGFGPLCAQHGASAKRRIALRAVTTGGVSAPPVVAPSPQFSIVANGLIDQHSASDPGNTSPVEQSHNGYSGASTP